MKKACRIILSLLLVLLLTIITAGCAPSQTAVNETEKPEETSLPTASPSEPPVQPTASVEPEKTPAPTKQVEEIIPETKELITYEVPEAGENGLINLRPFYPSRNARNVGEAILTEEWKANSLFDGTEEKIFCLTDNTSVEVIFITKVPVRVDYISFTSADDAECLPVDFSLYGYVDNSCNKGSLLFSTDTLVIPTENYTESELFKAENKGYYTFYKLTINSVNGGSNIKLGELSLFADPNEPESCIGEYTKYNSDISGYTVLTSRIKPRLTLMDPGPLNGEPKTCFDGDIETFVQMTLQWAQNYESISIALCFDSEIQMDAYRFTVGYFYGTPSSWNLYGTNDKRLKVENYVLVDSRTNVGMPLWDYGESDVFEVANPGSYKYYILEVTESALIGNDENWMSTSYREFTPLAKK